MLRERTEPGLVAFYDIWLEWVYSFNPGAHTGRPAYETHSAGMLALVI